MSQARRHRDQFFEHLASSRAAKWSHLPRLGWVISVSPSYVGTYSKELSALACYGIWHQEVKIFIETEDLLDEQPPRTFYAYRLGNLLKKYLDKFQWVVHTDVDIIIADYRRSPLEFLDDKFDVILQDRYIENKTRSCHNLKSTAES